MIGVILAAGRGTRLGALSRERSKAMQPIVGQPMVERVMDGLRRNGIERFVMVVGNDDAALKAHLAESPLAANLDIVEQRERLGMAHALMQAAAHLDGDFVLSACDNLMTDDDLARFFGRWRAKNGLDGLLALMQVPDEKIPAVGIVARDGERVTRIVEKPRVEDAPSNWASLPLYAFSARVLDYLERVPKSARGEYELQGAIQMLIDDGRPVVGVEVSGRMTVSRPADLLAVNRHFLRHMNGSVVIEEGAQVGADCAIGPEVYVESGARVGDGARIARSVVLRGGVVAAGAVVEDQVVGS